MNESFSSNQFNDNEKAKLEEGALKAEYIVKLQELEKLQSLDPIPQDLYLTTYDRLKELRTLGVHKKLVIAPESSREIKD